MKKIKFTKLSTKGQVVIPKELRKGLEPGTPFIVLRDETKIVLKKIPIEQIRLEFDRITKESQEIAKETGLKPIDVVRTRRLVRKSNSKK